MVYILCNRVGTATSESSRTSSRSIAAGRPIRTRSLLDRAAAVAVDRMFSSRVMRRAAVSTDPSIRQHSASSRQSALTTESQFGTDCKHRVRTLISLLDLRCKHLIEYCSLRVDTRYGVSKLTI